MWLQPDNWKTNYDNVIKEALTSESVYKKFKRDHRFNSIVGLGNAWYAQKHYDYIKENRPELIEQLSEYKAMDTIGGPTLWTSKDSITISPSTLRYLYTSISIDEHINLTGDNKPLKIIELGVGFGGLCYVMNQYYNVESYKLIDLPNVTKLAKKCLTDTGVTNFDDNLEEADLFVSEYCLSEFSDEKIKEIYENDMLKCGSVFIMSNMRDETRKKKFIELISEGFDLKIIPQYPEDKYPNYGMVGRRKK